MVLDDQNSDQNNEKASKGLFKSYISLKENKRPVIEIFRSPKNNKGLVVTIYENTSHWVAYK